MPGLWVQIATQVKDDPKFDEAGPAASWLWLRMLCHSKEHLSDGNFEFSAVLRQSYGLGNARKLAERLVKVGLWVRTETGYSVGADKWAKYQTTSADVETYREQARLRQQRFRERNAVSNVTRNVTRNALVTPPEPEPEPEPEREGVQGEMALPGEAKPSCALGAATADPREDQPEKAKPVRTHPFTAIVFPVTGGKTWRMDDELANQLTIAYRNLNVGEQLDRAKAWLLGNPSRMKTARGMGRFVSNWLSTAEKDRAKNAPNIPTRPRDVIPPPYQFSPDHDRREVFGTDDVPVAAWMACCEAVESLEAIAGVLAPERTARRPKVLLDRFRASLAPADASGAALVRSCKRLLSEPDTIRQLLADEVNA